MSKTHSYFDLFAHIKSIPSPEVAAQAAQSTAWRIDTLIISACRQLFKTVRQEQYDQGIDGMAEITSALNEQAYAESSFDEIGSHVTGPVTTIKELMFQREAWHNLAAELTPLTVDYKGAPRVYVEKTIEDQIFTPGAMKVNPDTKRKLAINAKRFAEAYEHPEMADELYKRKLARSEAQMSNIGETIKSQAQGVAHMFALAVKHPMEMPQCGTDANFYSLTPDTQRVLIDNCIRAVERAADQACEDRNMRDSDYDVLCLSAIKAVKELKSVQKSPRFVVAAQQEAAAETNLG